MSLYFVKIILALIPSNFFIFFAFSDFSMYVRLWKGLLLNWL